jgi:hypothetical protein
MIFALRFYLDYFIIIIHFFILIHHKNFSALFEKKVARLRNENTVRSTGLQIKSQQFD